MKRSQMKRTTPLRAKAPAKRERQALVLPAVKQPPRAVMALVISNPAPLPKETTYRGDDWLAAVRSLPNCVLCGAPGVEPAHRNDGKSMGAKTHDFWTAGICRPCHRNIDQGSSMTRDERRATLDRAIVLTLAELVLAGKVGLL